MKPYEVARALVAHPDFEPRPLRGYRSAHRTALDGVRWIQDGDRFVPDLEDAATGGVLLGMLAEAMPSVCVSIDTDGDVYIGDGPLAFLSTNATTWSGSTLARAAAVAWLAVHEDTQPSGHPEAEDVPDRWLRNVGRTP